MILTARPIFSPKNFFIRQSSQTNLVVPKRFVLMLLFAMLAVAGFQSAGAQTLQWSSGGITSQWGLNCSIMGNNYGEIMLQSFASYQRMSDLSAPKTGDTGYVSLVMSVPGSACNYDTSVGFFPELFLPSGVSVNISSSAPVRCLYKVGSNAWTTFSGTQIGVSSPQGTGMRVGPVCPDGLGGGYGTPFQMGSLTGPNGGLSMGTQFLPVSSMLEIQVPVRYARPLNGTTDNVQFTTYGPDLYNNYNSGNGQFSGGNTALHEVPVAIPFRPLFSNFQSSSITSSGARASANLSNFYTAGTAYVDYGLTASLGSSLTIGSIPNSGEGFSVFADLTGLTASSVYYWKIRFVTTLGTFSSPAQTFTTAAGTGGQTYGSLSLEVTGLPSGNSATLQISGPGGFMQSRTILSGTGQTLSDVVTGSYTVTAPIITVGSTTYTPMFAGQSVNVTTGGTTVRVVYTTAAPPPVPVFALTISKAGTGQGSVASSPAGINCGSTCSANFASGTSVTLTATPSSGSQFAGWGGDCSGTSTCTVSVNAAKNVTATFDQNPVTTLRVNVVKAGTGQGLVSSSPSGINCGSTCTTTFASGASVTLTAAPSSGSQFAGWSGDCSGTTTCMLSVISAKNVTATFNTTPVGGSNPSLAISVSPSPPGNSSPLKGATNVSVMAFTLTPGASESNLLTSLSLQASGTGNDATDLTAVKVFVDANANNLAEPGEEVGRGTFGADNGTLTIGSFTGAPSGLLINQPKRILVTVDISNQIASRLKVLQASVFPGNPLGFLVFLGIICFPVSRRFLFKKSLSFLLAITLLLMASCNTAPPQGAVAKTYQISLSSVSAKGATSNIGSTTTGLPISGATLSVQP